MSDFLGSSMTWLAGRKQGFVSATITYRRTDIAVSTTATLTSVLLKTADSKGNVKVERTDRDFILTTPADLTAGGIDLPPKRGDLIDVTIGSVTKRFALLPYGNDPLWYPCDGGENMIRVHGKYQGNV